MFLMSLVCSFTQMYPTLHNNNMSISVCISKRGGGGDGGGEVVKKKEEVQKATPKLLEDVHGFVHVCEHSMARALIL